MSSTQFLTIASDVEDDGFGQCNDNYEGSSDRSSVRTTWEDEAVDHSFLKKRDLRASESSSTSVSEPVEPGYARLLSQSYWKLDAKPIELPWERRGSIFSNHMSLFFFQRFKRPAYGALNVFTAPDINFNFAQAHSEVYTRAVRNLRDFEWKTMETANEVRAIGRWRTVIEYNFKASKLGEQLIQMMDNGATESDIQNCISDTFGIKNWKTLVKRAGSMLRFVEWAAKDFSGVLPSGKLALPPTEHVVYQYISWLKQSSAPPSTAQAFVQALRFAKHTIGLKNVDNVLASGRVQGAAQKQLVLKRPMVQAVPLNCQMILALESAACNAPNVVDRVAAGAFCCILYARARFGDAQRTEEIIWDMDPVNCRGYIELRARQVKTAGTAEKKSRFLPMTAPVKGISGLNWAQAWLVARMECELPSGKLGEVPLLPAPNLNGGWCKRPLSSSEAVNWMRQLCILFGVRFIDGVRAHSMKVTLLSWAAKRGLPPDVRKALGYHIDSNELSMMTYSRDAMARPLRKLEAMLAEVRLGTFLPDESRSGRLVSKPLEEASGESDLRRELTHLHEPEVEQAESDWYAVQNSEDPNMATDLVEPGDLTDCSSSSSSSSGSESDCEERVIFCAIPEQKRKPFVFDQDGCDVYQHTKYKTLHVKPKQETFKFKCGRTLHKGYKKITGVLRFHWPKCGQCYFVVPDGDVQDVDA